ncbi:lipase [Hazenella sp. IB182353]|nr:lipase [Polycladospora coralii]
MQKTQKETTIKPNVKIKGKISDNANNYPIVLVHGLGGWGRDEMHGYRYWGGLTDIEKDMKKKGLTVYTAAVGPVSSNWDRAVELYAQVKGGRVDYGKAHAEKHGHDRYGRTYEGFYPEWGEINPSTGKVNKIHLVGHSLGGQTIRLLDELIESGYKEEREATPSDDRSPLFNQENRAWIHSVTTVTTPHDGSPFAYTVDNFFPHIQQLIGFAAAATGKKDEFFYDFKLDQWGLKREQGESYKSYFNRVKNSAIWKRSLDTSQWDLAPEGARDLNEWVTSRDDVYYFSISAEQTYKNIFTGYHLPGPLMNPIMYASGFQIGRYTQNDNNGKVKIDKSWWENDGLVSVVAMDGPMTETSVPYKGTPQKGVWNDMGVLHHFDHLDVIGLGIRDMRDWYNDLGQYLNHLPD